jgi:hypothetical protein
MTLTLNLSDELQLRTEEMEQRRIGSVESIALEMLRTSLE